MLASPHITKWIAAVMVLSVLACFAATLLPGETAEASGGVTMEYESALFDHDKIITVNILMDESDWNEMLENAIDEDYYACDVVINGTKFTNVGIRTKGNTSLSSIASDSTTDRYSFKLEFDHYVSGQTCFGLDKLILNNNYADATSMKEALVYDLYQYLGVNASLYNYASISANGTYTGLYLALEAVEESFLLRNYGTETGNLYKPDTMELGGGGDDRGGDDFGGGKAFDGNAFGNGNHPFEGGFSQSADGEGTESETENSADSGTDSDGGTEKNERGDFSGFAGGMTPPEGESSGSFTPPSGTDLPENFDASDLPEDSNQSTPGGGFSGGFGNGSGGADLNYTDDELSSYSDIWDGAVNDSTDSDHRRVITALQNVSAGTELETYLNTDNVLRYLAVHLFSVNDDSLSGSMAHNYYLYESDGQLDILPWDYNLAFGGMSGSDASDVVNSPIDDAFSLTDFFDALLENSEYHERFYSYMKQIAEYFENGSFDVFYARTRSLIDSLVEADPTAFYTYEEYDAAAEMLVKTVTLRAESVRGQAEGTIPSTKSAQQGSDALVDASEITISVMGTMNNGGGGGNLGGNFAGGRGGFDKSFEKDRGGFGTPGETPDGNLQNREESGGDESSGESTQGSAE